jgi:hypothetical protein
MTGYAVELCGEEGEEGVKERRGEEGRGGEGREEGRGKGEEREGEERSVMKRVYGKGEDGQSDSDNIV